MIKERSWVEINLDNFEKNLNELLKYLLPHQQWLQIVKADAYGHGAYEISQTALKAGAAILGVANPEEGKMLRIQGVTAPILVLSPTLREEIPLVLEFDLMVAVSDYSFAQQLSRAAIANKKKLTVHIKIDTGMHRSGINSKEATSLYRKILNLRNIKIGGIFSHFAASDNNAEFSTLQQRIFGQVLSEIDPLPRYIHLSNSASLFSHNSFATNLVRLGIMSYGVYTNPGQSNFVKLNSVMTFKSVIAQVKEINKGDSVGYNCTWRAPRDGFYGIIPIGYADGYDFLLSNRGIVAVRDQICPVIGRVSMDMITVDLTAVGQVKVGDEVVMMGGGTNLLRSEQLAAKYEGSAYELLCQIGRRARRFYFKNSRLIARAPLSRRDFVPSDYSENKLGSIINAAIDRRLQDGEIAELIQREVLRGFFFNKDKDIHYRRNFIHTVEFTDSENPVFYTAKTQLRFRKVLQNNYFLVACANNETVLKNYFMRRDVEYRWLMDTNFELSDRLFKISKVKVNKLDLELHQNMRKGCLEIRCSHDLLHSQVGREVDFTIETQTLYPKKSHQLSIFITELTKGVTVKFKYPSSIRSVETQAIFSGRNKFPTIRRSEQAITVSTDKEEWVFPNSGIVFAY